MSSDQSPQSATYQENDDARSAHQFSLASTWQTIVELVNAYDDDGSELQLEALEARVLYDASPLIAVAGESIEPCAELELDDMTELCFEDHSNEMAIDTVDCEDCEDIDSQTFGDEASPVATVSRQLVVVDERIEGFESLVDDIMMRGDQSIAYDVLIVSEEKNGIELVSSYLNGLATYGAVHIVGHGGEDQIQLGSVNLSSESLSEYESELQSWNRGLASNADILLYGCEVAASEQGQELVNQISLVTGADVAASDDLTGSANLGADWEFEYIVGQVEAEVAFSIQVQQNLQSTLAITTVTTLEDVVSTDADLSSIAALNANPGFDQVISLREAIRAANANTDADVIYLGAGVHTLSISDLDINADVQIIGLANGSTVVDASALFDMNTMSGERVFSVFNNSATFEHLTITGGHETSIGGGGIRIQNGAEAILNNVVVTDNHSTTLGGGIANFGTLTVTNSTISSNTAVTDGGGISSSSTIGIQLTNVTVSGNEAGDEGGGVRISNGSSHDLTNVTLSGNEANDGGGLAVIGGAGVDLTNVTIANNTANNDGGGIFGRNIPNINDPNIDVQATIVTGNSATNNDANVDSNHIDDLGFNLIGGDPDLIIGDLADNGGPVQTHALLSSTTDVTGIQAETDSRGFRVNDGNRDSGAFEFDATPASQLAGLLFTNDNQDVIQIRDPDLTIENGDGSTGTSDGTFSELIDFQAFADPATPATTSVNAIHRVATHVTFLGVDLQPGDVLFSTTAPATYTSNNSVMLNPFNLHLFRPDTPGDYSMGTFTADIVTGVGNIGGFTLVETDTNVGGQALSAGDFLFHNNSSQFIQWYDSNSSAPPTILVDGAALGLTSEFTGIELIERAHTSGDITLDAGTLLLTTAGASSLGSNNIATDSFDVVALNLTSTGPGNNTAGTASIVFDGSDVGLTSAERFSSLSLETVPDVQTDSGVEASLLLSTSGNPSISDHEIVEFDGISLDPTAGVTDGSFATFAEWFSLTSADIDGFHRVGITQTVDGTGLQQGDVLFSSSTFNNFDVAGSSILANPADIYLFRPNTIGDYSAGTFSIYAASGNIGESVQGFTLVEQQTTVGDRVVNVGDILYGTQTSNHVHHYDAASQTPSILIDGNDLGLDAANDFTAIELIEEATVVDGVTFEAGQLLLSNRSSETNNGVTIGSEDVYRLDVTSTGAGTTSGASDIVFDGSDVGFTPTQSIDSLALNTFVDAEPTLDLSSGIELNDGGNDAFLISDGGLGTDLDATTFEIQFAATDTPEETVFVSFNSGSGGSGDELAIQTVANGNLELDFGSGGLVFANQINYATALLDGERHSLAVTWDSASGNWEIYIDGQLRETGSNLNENEQLDTTNGRFVFGQDQDGLGTGYEANQRFDGTIYDVRIWDGVRSATEIAENYQQKLDPNDLPNGLVANWQFDGFVSNGQGGVEVVDVVDGNNLSVGHATGADFVASTPVDALNVDENSSDGTSVGFVIATSNGDTSQNIFTLSNDAGGRFAIDSATGEITVANRGLLNHEVNQSHVVTVAVSDGAGNDYGEDFTITVNNVNDRPTFDAAVTPTFSVGNTPNGASSVITADIDGDGHLDLVSTASGEIVWHQNDGAGGFNTAQSVADLGLLNARSVTATDVDGDGHLDLVAAFSNVLNDEIVWFRNDGSENFTAESIATNENRDANSVTTADVDGDGDIDVLVTAGQGDSVIWYENDGSENFTGHEISDPMIGADGASSVTTADVDGDGDLDVLAALRGEDTIAWYENDGDQNFTRRDINTTGFLGTRSVTTADVDGDGDIDVVGAAFGSDEIAWFENDGNENFTKRIVTDINNANPADGANSVTTADIDADGDLDILSTSLLDNEVVWYENDGNQGFTAHTITSAAGASSIAVGDLNNDGHLDVIAASLTDGIVLAESSGSQFFTLDGPATTMEGVSVVIDDNVEIFDDELSALNGGLGDFGGATLRVRALSTSNGHVFESGGALTFDMGDFLLNGDRKGTFVTGTTTITLTFDAGVTNDEVNEIMQSLRYNNISGAAPASVNFTWTFNDRNDGSQGSGGDRAAVNVSTVNIIPVNDAPTITGLDSNVAYTENAAPVVIDNNVALFDAELDALGTSGNYDGATLHIARAVSASTEDVFGNSGLLGPLVQGNDLVYDGEIVGSTVIYAGGQLQLEFNSNATDDVINGVAQSITYANSSDAPPASVNLEWTFNDRSTSGGGSRFDVANIQVDITEVNDAPVLASGANPQFDSITEDQINNGGELISDLLAKIGDPITDPDGPNVVEGIAVIVNGENAGTWQYSIDNGATWQDVGNVSQSSALLLRANDLLRLNPDGVAGGNANLGFRAWDQTSGGIAGDRIDIAANGGTGGSSAFSLQTLSAQIDVMDVNDAPTVDLDSSALGDDYTTDYVAGSSPVAITNVGNSSIADVDNPIEQLTVTLANFGATETIGDASGSLPINRVDDPFTGEITFTNNGSATNADFQTLLDSLTYSNTDLTATGSRVVTIVANDGLDDSPGATTTVNLSANDIPVIDLNGNGMGINPNDVNFSEGSGARNIAMGTFVNDFMEDDIVTLTIDANGFGANAGDLLIVEGVGGTDPTFTFGTSDSHGFTTASGVEVDVQYDGNQTFTFTFTNQAGATVPIPADELQTIVRSIQYRNTSDSLVDATIDFEFTVEDNVGQESVEAMSRVNVQARNDAPMLNNNGPNPLTAIDEDNFTSSGNSVADIISRFGLVDPITDADGPGVDEGIAIFSVNTESANGTWQYLLPVGGATWVDFGAVSPNAALLLSADALVRFVPNPNFNGEPAFSYQAWDQTVGIEGSTIALTGNTGGSNTLSIGIDTAEITVNAVNDAPTLSNNGGTVNEGGFVALTSLLTASDIDDTAIELTYTVSAASNGQLEFSNAPGVEVISFTQAQIDSGEVRFVHDGSETTTASFDFSVEDGGEDGASPIVDTFTLIVNPINDDPDAGDDAFSTDENTTLTATLGMNNLLQNDSDAEGNMLMVTSPQVSGPSNGSLVIGTDGTFTYTPNAGFSGDDSFTYEVTDGNGGSAEATVTITVNSINDAPEVDLDADDNIAPGRSFETTFTEGAGPVLVTDVDATITDVDDANLTSLTVSIVNFPDGADERLIANPGTTGLIADYNDVTGILTLSGPGTLAEYQQVLRTVAYENLSEDPDTSQRILRVVASDSQNDSLVAESLIDIVAVNDRPVVNLDAATTSLDFNATFVAGAGPVSLTGGPAVFDIDSTIQTLTIQISNLPDGADEMLGRIDNPNIVPTTNTTNGTLTLTGNANATNDDFRDVVNSLTYNNLSTTPDTTTRTITFVANDGARDSIMANTFVSVTGDNTAPTAVNNLGSTVDEGGSDFIEGSELSYADLQPTGDITFDVTSATSNGFLAFANNATVPITRFTQEDIDNNNLVYIHEGTETVSDSFTFTVDDGQGNSQSGQIFNITVIPQNDAPVIAVAGNTAPGNLISSEDIPLVFSAANGNLITISDPDAGNSLIEVTVSAANGTITLGSTLGIINISNGTGTDDSTVTFRATHTIAEEALDGLTFTPTENFNGGASIMIMTNDLGNSGVGGPMEDMETINITLTPVNDAPVAMDDTFVTNEDTPLNVVTQSILDNDDDVDDALVITQLSGTSNGTLTLNPDGTFEYVPDANFFGTDSFTYQLEDPSGATSAVATVTIEVLAVNDGPTGGGFVETRLADLTPLSQSGLVTFRENAGHSDAQITIDGQSYYHGIGVFPRLGGAEIEYDLDGANLFTAVAALNDTLSPSGQVTFRAFVDGALVFNSGPVDANTPAIDVDFDTTGGSVLRLEVDSGGSPTEDHAVWANALLTGAQNQPTTISIAETAPFGTFVGTYNGNDIEGDTLSYSLVDQNGPFAIDAITGAITVADPSQLDFETETSHTITVQIFDGLDSAFDTVTIELSDVNESPTGTDIAITIDEDTTHNFEAANFGFSDPDGNPFAGIRVVSLPTGGTLTLNGAAVTNGQDVNVADLSNLVYTPAANGNGQNFGSFEFLVRDSRQTLSDSPNTLTFHVIEVNDSPTDTLPNSVLVPENTDTTGGLAVATLVTSDVDVGETFTYSIVGGPDAANFSINGDELVLSDGLLDHETRDQYNVVVRATDSGGLTHDESITVVVQDVNEAPVVNNQSAVVDEGQPVIFDSTLLSASDPEQSPNALTYSIETLPVNGELFLDGNLLADGATFTQTDVDSGRVRYDHNGTNTTSDSFTFRVTDGQLQTPSQTFSLVINPVNDVPVAGDDSFTAIEDTPRNLQVLLNDVDDDGDSLSVSVTSAPNRGGTVSVNADGSFDYQPAANFFGTETFDYQVDDGNGGTSTATVTVNVLSQNDAPVVRNDFYQVIPGEALVSLESVLQNDFDIEGSALSAILLSPPANGSLSFQPNGQFIYVSTPGFVGLDEFTYLASDGTATSVARVEIAVASAIGPLQPTPNQSPNGTPETIPGFEDNSPLDPTSSDDGGNDNSSTSQDDEADNSGNGIFVLPKSRPVQVLDLQESVEFSVNGELEDLVPYLADQDRARSVLKSLLQNLNESDLADVNISEELEELRSNATFAAVFDAQFLFDQLDDVEVPNSILGDFEITVGAITAFGTIGYVLWALRGGALVALALSQLPAWQMIDPLPILDGYEGRKKGPEEELDGFFTS